MFCYYKQHKGDNFSIEEVKNIIANEICLLYTS
ncbi:hypothetical protein G0W92_10340, partial [Staphylococcus aureus]|nr:hypothetical protein [Staphylococcus aureus]